MKTLTRLAIYLLVANLLPVNFANAASGQNIRLAEAIDLVLENNPQFRTYQLRQEALNGERQSLNQKPAMRFSSEIENVIGTGDLNWFQGTELTLALSQVIELGGKQTARTQRVSQRQNLLEAEQRILELDLLSETASRFIELAGVTETQASLGRSTQLAAELFEVVSARVVAGRAPEAEQARAAAALALAELAEQSAGFAVQEARLKLSSLWGELSPDFTHAESSLMEVRKNSDINVLLASVANNPAIEVFASESRLREAELREASSKRYADIEVGAGIRHLAELNDTAFMLQFSMPLASKRRARGAITTAQANLLRVNSEKESALLRLQAQLLILDQQRQSSVQEFTALQSRVIPQLTLALDATRAAFESGRYSYLELSAAQKELLNAELSQIRAAIRAHLQMVEIERLSGESFAESAVLDLTNINFDTELRDAFNGGLAQ